MPTGFEKQTAQRATDCGETPLYDSKVVAPRNPKLIRGPKEEVKMTPSSFMKEVAQTTDEKLANTHAMYIPKIIELLDMGENTHQKFSMVDIDEPLFQPFPSEVTFQQFEPHVIYEVPLLLRNNDKVSRLVKVYQADSPYFKIISPQDVTTKVAPGMATIFRIQFTPSEKRDYIHELICMTEREKFVVPVRAIGARAMLDFPDEVNFSMCSVKYPSTKTLLVRNIGNKDAHFALYASGAFSVTPENGILAVNDSIQVELTFQPMTVGDHSDDLVVNYDSGEDIYVNLYGGAYDANVRLDKNSLRIENTYIAMANQRTVTIANRSDVIVHYKWKQYATHEEEQQHREGFFGHIDSDEQSEHDAFLQECIMDPTLRDRMAILTRTFQNRRTIVDGDELFFSDDAFTIMPKEGDIWPNSTGEINVIFKPTLAKTYNQIAYCDITGRETRLPLRLKGDGVGPQVFFSYDTMNMGHIFINSQHSYEVVLGNRGDIDASYRLAPSDSTFGPYFSFSPDCGVLEPGGYQAIEVTFASPLLGDFSEDFFWEVEGLPYQHKLNFRGCVIGPTFHFDVPRLKFGTISYGFKSTEVATLVNTALVPMSFSLRVPGDGEGEVVSATSGEVTLGRSNLSTPAREFQIVPASGTIDPQSEVKIEVELTSNSLKKYDLALVVDVEGVGQELLSLPISAKCVVPMISVVTPILDYTRCFLNHPYELSARLCNDSDLPAKYDLIPQEVDEETPLLFNSPQPTGILPPHTTLRVPLVITPQALEELETYAEFDIFGSMEPPLQVTLKCIGEGPVVHVTPVEIDWGQTTVLTDVSRVVTLSNESLIPAPFTCHMVRPNTLWKVEPSEGIIPPEDTLEVKLTVNLDDCIRFQDKLAIDFKHSQTRMVKVQAYGHGTTIVSEPPIIPTIELGHHFSSKPSERTFKLTNRGRRHQQLFWTTEGFAPIKIKSREPEYNPLDVKYQRMPPPAPPPRPVFSLTPSRFELEAGESIEVHLEGASTEPKVVKERLLCHAIIGRTSGKERIMKTDVSITFISPLIQFSNKQVAFRVDKHPDDVLTKQYNELTMTNISSLPLNTTVALEEPFQIIEDGIESLSSMDVPLEVGESKLMTIQFDPAYQTDSHTRIAEKLLTVTYQEHPHTDYVSLRGEVFFPNLTFEKMEVNFGCILNDTEVTRYVNIANNSPMAVNYRWSFLEPETPIMLYPLPIPPEPELPEVSEDMFDEDSEADTHVAFEDPLPDEDQMEQDGDQPLNEEEGEGAESGEEKMDEMKDADEQALSENILDKLEIQISSPKPPTLVDDADKLTLKSSHVDDKDIASEKESRKDGKKGGGGGTHQDKKKSPRKSTAKSGGSKTHSKTSVKTASDGKKQDDDLATVDQPLSDRDPPIADEDIQTARIPSPFAGIRPGTATRQKLNKLQYIQAITEPTAVGIEEVFDILPLYGTLLPGESDTVTFTFYGHTEIGSQAKALCHVEGGPCYELDLKGEASFVQYDFDLKNIDYGKQMYDHVCMAEITLRNTGKVNFDFRALNMDPTTSSRPVPGVPVMIPHAGHVEAYSEQKLLIKFLPGYPEKFHKSFEIQVAHFEPDSINICGEGVFPRVSMDLPRFPDEDGLYASLMKEAKENLGRDIKKKAALPPGGGGGGMMNATPIPSPTPRDPSQEDAKSIMSLQNEFPSELEFQLEVERLLVKEFAIECQQQSGQLDTDRSQQPATPRALMASVLTSRSKRNVKTKARLPDYLLDFGFVVLGNVRTHIIRATNTGYFPASFSADRVALSGTGFNVELDRVRHLPGFPDHETVDFRVIFDPQGSNLGLGPMEALVPINIISGPCMFLRLRATVTMPDMEISTDCLEFGDVQCGQCKVVTIQLHNHKEVRCEWSSLPTEKEKKLVDKHMPLHLRRKLKPVRSMPRNFEMMPPTGMLLPGQRVNVQVKFMPTEEKLYSDRLTIRIEQSSQRLTMMASGIGLEPRLELSQSLLEFGPILPHSPGDEKEVVVRNPCTFPIEFYSLEFDKQYLAEEKMLRLMKDYDDHQTLLLPPRVPGEKLPEEIVEFYEEQKKRLEEEEEAEKAKVEAEIAAKAAAAAAFLATQGGEDGQAAGAPPTGLAAPSPRPHPSSAGPSQQGGEEGLEGDKDGAKTDKPLDGLNIDGEKLEDEDAQDKKETGSTLGVGELIEITPVSQSIARHLGIDLSPEGKAAMRRRGLALVVHGAPLSGKTTTSIALAKHYEAALLTVDSVVLDAISNGNTPAGLRAREMCAQMARAQLAREGDGSEGQAQGTGGALSMEAVYAHTQGLGAASGSQMGAGGAHSVISNRKTSTISGHKPGAHSTVGGEDGATTVAGAKPDKADKKDKKGAKQEGDTTTQMSSSPPPAAPIARRLSVSASVAGDEGLMSCILPDDLLVEILAERMQLNDCHKGVVFDGLETLFSPNQSSTAKALLTAFNNRKYIYFVTLKLDQVVLQAREKRQKEEKEQAEEEQEEAERQRLEEMSEDEYDALPDDQKAAIDQKRLKTRKERLHKKEMEERLERERKERELLALMEEKKLEDDKVKKKKGAKQGDKESLKGGPPQGQGKKAQDGKAAPSVSQATIKKGGPPDSAAPSEHALKGVQSTALERPESHGTAGSDQPADEGTKKKKKDKGRPISNEVAMEAEIERDPVKEAEMMLTCRFKAFEHGMKEIDKVLTRWDRTTATIVPDPAADEVETDETPAHPPSGRKGKSKAEKEKEKERERERLERERLEKEKAEKAAAESGEQGETKEGEGEGKEGEEKEQLGVANIIIDASEPDDLMGQKVLDMGQLPTNMEVLDGLGLGPSGPPIPPPASFSVIPYPVKRKSPLGFDPHGHYYFVASSPDDPNIGQEEKPKEAESELEAATPDKGPAKEEFATPTGRKGKDKLRPGAESTGSRRRSAKGARNRKGSLTAASPPPGTTTPASDFDGQSSTTGDITLQDSKNVKLTIFRWTVPAEGEVTLKLRFQSDELGQFDQTLNFEIVGTRRRYQLFCRGVCSFPNISREPRVVFPHRKKSKKADEIVHKKYILSTELLQMGPLLAGKSRDRYKDGKYPENMEKLTILNTSPLEAEMTFCYQHDGNGTTFLLDPPNMVLKPNQSQELTVWVYPKNQGYFEDTIVCCIKENPEPVQFKVGCYGVRPELELDKKQLHFEKVLLHRKDTKTIYLRNSTLLPVAWRISGLESLGDDFSVSTDSGVIEPKSEFALNAHFRAMKPVNTKKMIRLEVSDMENIMGLLQTENIQVLAEAYDVALDMSFPKGADGGLDFGIIKVLDETKQTCSLKNKGRYEIAFSFVLEATPTSGDEIINLFSVIPAKGVLVPNDRPTQVQVIFKSRREVTIKDQPILKCQVIEPNLKDGGETIASIPVKLSVRSIFSKHNIYPVNDINFGAVLVNQRKSRTFQIENKGEFDFKYTVNRMVRDMPVQPAMLRGRAGSRASKVSMSMSLLRPPGTTKRSKSRDGSSSGRSVAKPKRAESIRQEIGGAGGGGAGGGGGGGSQTRLQLGMFTIYPAYGLVSPGNQATVNIDCLPEAVGTGAEDLAVDISDREPSDHPQGIPYKVMAEACIPGINLNDLGSMFEEHRIVKNLSVFLNTHQLELGGGGVFGEDENKFIFGHVLVGRKAKARFKISNAYKVTCDVSFACKLQTSKPSSKLQDIFDVEPARASIPAHGSVYATVSFSPPSMQTYTGQFEVAVEGLTGPQAKLRNLSFEVQGEGNLPRVSVIKPSLRNKKGTPLLLFKRLLTGRSQTLPLCLANDGTLPSKVDIDLDDASGCFKLKSSSTAKLIYPTYSDTLLSEGESSKRHPHAASLIIQPAENSEFHVVYTASAVGRSAAQVRITVTDNQFENQLIQIVGEGYHDDVTLDNIHSLVSGESIDGTVEDEHIAAAPSNHIHFGDCHINDARQLSFTMTNHSPTDTIRFQWPESHAQVRFSPAVGHLHAGCAKDVVITFKTEKSVTLTGTAVLCKMCKINFDKPVDQVMDWDDRLRTVKWVDNIPSSQRPGTSGDPSGGRQRSAQDVKREERESRKEKKGGGGNAAAQAAAAAEAAEKERNEEEMRRRMDAAQEQTRPCKRKIIETEPEPTHSVKEDSNRELELMVSANADFCKFKCKVEAIHFKDTLMFQTRIFTFQMTNKGNTELPFSWQVVMEEEAAQQKTVSFADGEQLRLPSRCSTGVTSDAHPDVYPFTVDPEVGSIAAGKKQNFQVKFVPLDIKEFEGRLICRVPNLEEGKQGPVLAVKARSMMPYCHFELEDSDYITGSRRNPELPGPGGAPPGSTLDPNTRVIEFASIGVQVKNTRQFFMVNPTATPYTFQWQCEDEDDPKRPSVFTCVTLQGQVASGKKTQVSFEFLATQLGVIESFWRFTIPEQNISVPFLLVGDAHEPAVSTDRSHINFKSMLLGNKAYETVYLINNEDRPFDFEIDETSCHSEAFSSRLDVAPMKGTIQPNDRIPIDVSFIPRKEKVVNFNVQIHVRKKTLPICLNVKAEGYSMNSMVLCEDSTGQKKELNSAGVNTIDFGEIEVNEKAVRSLYIINTGKFNFDFEWALKEETKGSNPRLLSINPESGGVPCNDRKRSVLSFKPTFKTTLRACELICNIANGPTYEIKIIGHGVAPGLHFSFPSYDFGPCFIHRAGMPTHSTTLTVTNRDSKDISVDCLYASTSHLQLQFDATVLSPGDSRNITFTFYPREAVRYHEIIQFELNGLSRTQVEIFGLGTEMRVEVANPKDRVINFGGLRIGETAKRLVPIANNSPAPLAFNVAITPLNPILQQVPNVLRLAPTQEISLKAKGGASHLELVFSPKCRIPQFTEEVMLECAGLSQPLLVVTGSCQGIEISLDQESIPFGAVVLKSSTTRKLLMYNTGDVGAAFKWNASKFAPDFSISPEEGYISQGMTVTFEVKFEPTKICQDIRYDKLLCAIEGSRPLHLVLTGMCVGCQPQKEILHFSTHVRVKDTRSLTLHNRTNQRWAQLKPVIEGEHWTGAEAITVEPQQSRPYELVYRPLVMTSEGKKHTGSVFFALPDGSGMLYNMVGVAESPKAAGNITRDIPSKTHYTESMPVSNWLKRPQRFKVTIEMIKPDKLDPATTLKGLDYIDVPGLSKRDYKLNFFCHKEASYAAKIVFRNEQTNEFQFYYITFKSTPPGIIDLVEMSTPVRLSTSHTISLDNPLAIPVTFQTNCPISDIMVPPQLIVPPQSEGILSFEFLPLKVGETSGKLTLTSNELGQYAYDLQLTATAAGPEKAVFFRASLGGSHTQSTKFINFAKVKTEYSCKIDNGDFHCDKTITAAPGSSGGSEVGFDISFEPSRLGETRGTLTLHSPLGGEYTFPLFGTCIAPKPQGPYNIKAGSTTSIPFRNIFSHTTAFTFQVDNPAFTSKPGEQIRGKKTHNVIIGFEGNTDGTKAPKMGKLVVTCARSAGGAANVSWTYYLKGITP